jgi:hypothetical protein
MVTAPGRRERVAGSRRLLPVCGVLTGPGRFPEGPEGEFNLRLQRRGWRALAEDCPGDRGAAAGHVDRLGQRCGVALPELALPDGRLGKAAGQPRRPRSKPPGWRVALRQDAQVFAPSSGAQATSPLALPAAAEVTRVSVISPAEAKVTSSVLKLRPSGGRPGCGLPAVARFTALPDAAHPAASLRQRCPAAALPADSSLPAPGEPTGLARLRNVQITNQRYHRHECHPPSGAIRPRP